MRSKSPLFLVSAFVTVAACNVTVNDKTTKDSASVSTSTTRSSSASPASSKPSTPSPSASASSSAAPAASGSSGPSAGPSDAHRTVDPFTEVHVSNSLEADIDIGPQAPLDLTGDDEIIKAVKTDVSGGVLTIKLPSGSFHMEKPLKVHVVVPKITALKADTSATIVASSLASDGLKVEVETSATVTVGGTCKKLEAKTATSAKLDAGALVCEEATIDAATSSDAKVNASASVHGTAATSAHVHVAGNPKDKKVDAQTSGSVD